MSTMSRKKALEAAAALAAQGGVQPATEAPKSEEQAAATDAAQAAAEQAAETESTLGDGDATGAADVAPSATAAPQAPAPDVETDERRGPEGWTVRVVGPAKGRWRAGRKFGPEEVAIPASELTDAEFAKLSADPELKIELTEDAA